MASVLRPGRALGVAELSAARLDGEVFEIDEAFAPVDEAEGIVLRALALRGVTTPRMIAELDSALWIRGIRFRPPAVHRVCVSRTDRIKFAPSPRLIVREVMHEPRDVEHVAGMRVTVPARILFDLALLAPSRVDDDARSIIERWPEAVDGCLNRLERTRNLPGKRVAFQRIDRWTGQPALTRYTS